MIPVTAFPLLLLVSATTLLSQNLPDRHVVLDPLGSRALDTAGFSWLGATRLYAEFARYSAGSGGDHRWNAKTGGYAELARWDSSTSIALIGTTEVVVDPNNDISFNPRAIFWEEGAIVSFRLPGNAALQAGYVHRCKHDIDNLEILEHDVTRTRIEQRTLIYSGILLRGLWRRRQLVDGALPLFGSMALRNDFYLHLLDDRLALEARTSGRSIESLISSTSLTGRIEAQAPGAAWMLHLSINMMATFAGSEPGFSERFSGISLLGSVPFIELGLDLFNPRGAMLTAFARGEWQRDAGIATRPRPGRLFMFGLRMSSYEGMF